MLMDAFFRMRLGCERLVAEIPDRAGDSGQKLGRATDVLTVARSKNNMVTWLHGYMVTWVINPIGIP